jgi:hypothetical protein
MNNPRTNAQVQRVEDAVVTIETFGTNIHSRLFASAKEATPTDMLRDISLDPELVDLLRPILEQIQAGITNETLQSMFDREDQHIVTVVRQPGREVHLLSIKEELLLSDNQEYKAAMMVLRAFFADNKPGANLFIIHQDRPPFIYYTTNYRVLCQKTGIKLTFLPASNLKDLEEVHESERPQMLATLLNLESMNAAVVEIRKVTLEDVNEVCRVMQVLGIIARDDLQTLLASASLDYLRPDLNLVGVEATVVPAVVNKAAQSGIHRERPGYHCLGMLVLALCDNHATSPTDKQSLVKILEQCALVPAGEIQRLKR